MCPTAIVYYARYSSFFLLCLNLILNLHSIANPLAHILHNNINSLRLGEAFMCIGELTVITGSSNGLSNSRHQVTTCNGDLPSLRTKFSEI